jgi:hypothetical protein
MEGQWGKHETVALEGNDLGVPSDKGGFTRGVIGSGRMEKKG